MNDIESRERIIDELSAEVRQAQAEMEKLKGQLSNQECDTAFWKERATKAAEQERAAVVAFLMERNKNTSYAEAVRIATWQFAEMIKQGLHGSDGIE